MKSSILIIDDEPNLCWTLQQFLEDQGHDVASASSAEDGLKAIRGRRPHVVLLDIILPGMSGLELLDQVRKEPDPPAVIMMTAHGTMSTAIEAIQKGAYEYLTKPFESLEKVGVVIGRALESRKLSREVVELRSKLGGEYRIEDVMIGSSLVMQEVYKKIGMLCTSDATVLIEGESGTGKELAARAIHYNSRRKEAAFVPVNCGSLSETLLESEIYGHEKGAFTGAISNRIGKFERANGGTIFLDEINNITPATQVSLLRFLEDKTIERVGGNERIELDVRVVAASNQVLKAMVDVGDFREDLYYRLNVVGVLLPSLCERREDIPALVEYFLSKNEYAQTDVSSEAMKMMTDYDWPGNVRELRNAVEHALVVGRGAVILPEHLPVHLRLPGRTGSEEEQVIAQYISRLIDEPTDSSATNLFENIMDVWEEPLIRLVMQRFEGNQVKASDFLGIHRTTLRNKMKKYDLY